jgi:hypothetical protein
MTAFACDENDAGPAKTKLLTIHVDPSYSTDGVDNWIVVHDEKATA